MKIEKTDFEDLLIINHNICLDSRGLFKEVFRNNIIEENLCYKLNFCQYNDVKSYFMVLRGLHYQEEPYAQSKLISVSVGEILDVAVDIRKESDSYGKYFSHVLSSENHESLFIPKGFAHGYLTLSDYALINYKVDNIFKPNMESGIFYNDKHLKINWGVDHSKLIISEKDKNLKNFIW